MYSYADKKQFLVDRGLTEAIATRWVTGNADVSGSGEQDADTCGRLVREIWKVLHLEAAV